MLLRRTPRWAATSLGGNRAVRLLLGALIGITVLAFGLHDANADQPLRLPFPGNVAVQIIQGYNGGTHVGVERYSLDLVRADGATSDSPVVAPASGTVAFAQLPASEHGCIGVAMDNAGDLHYMLCHIMLNHLYSYGDRIQYGQSLGTIGAPGLVGNNGTAHIHMQLYTLPNQQRTPVPFAAPLGIPLDTVAMPNDGSSNEWACAGSSCRLWLSSNLTTSATLIAASPPAAATSALSSSPVPAVSAQAASLAAGKPAVVQGTGDCLRVHMQPRMEAATTGCAPDGTVVSIADGPQTADGHTWWLLSSLGWSVSDYLRPAGTAAAAASAVPSPVATNPGSASPALAVGSLVRVTGTGDCLRLHTDPSLSSAMMNCLPDGSLSAIKSGPRSADGHQWWMLDMGGWAAADYLQLVP